MSVRKSFAERQKESKNYNLYCVNFYGSGLSSLKDVFKRQVQTGLRRSVFILDLEELQERRNTQHLKEDRETSREYLMNNVLQTIQNVRREYNFISRKIEDELKFDLYQYWLKHLDNETTTSMNDVDSLKDRVTLNTPLTGKVSANIETKKLKSKRVSRKSLGKTAPSAEEKLEESCVATLVREHNRVGQGEMLSKRKFIRDEPNDQKLFIIIIGMITEDFYLDLLRRGQPVQGIVHFLPAKSNYDILLNNPKQHSFIQETLKLIDKSIYRLRQVDSMKPVGIFTHELPVISPCLANKYQKDIYDQLTWGLYDIEVLQEQYQTYYYKAFQETNVTMPLDVNLIELYHLAESLSMEGHFQQHSLPCSASDISSIIIYLDSLLNACCHPQIINSKFEFPREAHNKNASINSDFDSITKIRKMDHLFIDESNQLLNNMLLYVEESEINNIYLCNLDYHLWKQYTKAPCLKEPSLSSLMDPLYLPEYLRFYPTEDSCAQKISELLSLYDSYEIITIEPDCKLYTFRRVYNEALEDERLIVIPTRLCFRDFTLFQREEFLENLITPEMRKSSKEKEKTSSLTNGGIERELKMMQVNEQVFIRPNSLKATKLTERDSGDMQLQGERENQSRRNPSRQYDKRSTLPRKSSISQEWVGLPPNHHLLKGYNLGDTRQEIRLKTTQYFFENGRLQLYEEKWSFEDMNNQLILTINDCSLFFNRPRYQVQGISNNIRLETKSHVNIHISGEPEANNHLVMNYPNGLRIFYNPMHCEQMWDNAQSFKEEKRRICTPYGAVIVFYRAQNEILIMRYNGEVYKLLQYELAEEEGEDPDIQSEFSENPSSELSDLKAQGDFIRVKPQMKPEKFVRNRRRSDGEHQASRTTLCRRTQKSASEESTDFKLYGTPILSKTSITDELEYLNNISSVYGLSYIHLMITTSQGRNISLRNQGKIVEEIPYDVQEWHDYFANESYCQRSDGVKMIWTQDSLKCYHQDGTVLITKTEESFKTGFTDEFEFQISQSSSHVNLAEEEHEACCHKSSGRKSNMSKSATHPPNTSCLAAEDAEEVTDDNDDAYLCYTCSSCLMQHQQYAGVYIFWLKTSTPDSPLIFMKILGVDNISIFTTQADPSKGSSKENIYTTKERHITDNSNNLVVNVRVGTNLHMTFDRKGCELVALMDRIPVSKQDNEVICDSLTLRLLFEDCLTDKFKYLINEIATFYNYKQPITKALYFVERTGIDGKAKGFEFLQNLPNMPSYSHTSGNCILEMKPFQNIRELTKHKCDEFVEDMKKFPRFPAKRNKKRLYPNQEFPKICTTSIYFKVPLLLQDTKNVGKFLETFENINFKKLRPKMKEFLDIRLRPKLDENVKWKHSLHKWHKRHQEHDKRKCVEQQRKGLYHAMLKHNVYPNYFKFIQKYRGQVSNIDYFDFVKFVCEDKGAKKDSIRTELSQQLE